MTDSATADSRLMRDKEYQSPNERATAAGKSGESFSAFVNLEKLVTDEDGSKLSANYLLNIFVDQIKQRPIKESRTSIIPDKILSGYLQITQALLEVSPVSLKQQMGNQKTVNLVHTLFDFLFQLPNTQKDKSNTNGNLMDTFNDEVVHKNIKNQSTDQDVPKCKAKLTRKRTFNLLHTLCSGCPNNYTQLLGRLFEFHKQIQDATNVTEKEEMDEFLSEVNTNNPQVQSSIGFKSRVGYLGLRNFGCTCYMNSMLQQLFMMPDFRAGILNSKVDQQQFTEKPVLAVLHELANTFAQLQESEKQFYSPGGFTKVFQFYG
jgi:hypothetical protein